MAGYIGSKASVVSSGVERKKTYSITGSTTSLTGLNYTVGKVHVYQNGVRLLDGTDYTATNGTSITLTVAAQSGDNVVVVSQASFQLSEHYTSAEADSEFVTKTGDTMSGNLNVTGTVTSDGLTMGDGHILALGDSSEFTIRHTSGGNTHISESGSGNLNISARDLFIQDIAGTNHLKVDGNLGDISFYEDTGTTAKFFWDASTERLGLGTSSPSADLHIASGSANAPHILLENTVSSGADPSITFADSVENYGYRIGIDDTGNGLVFTYKSGGINPIHGVDSERMRIDSSGNVSIGSTSAHDSNAVLTLSKSGVASSVLKSTTNSVTFANVVNGATSVAYSGTATNHPYYFMTNSTERMRIDSSGNVLVGKTTTESMGSATAGHTFYEGGTARHTVNSGEVMNINRLNSDGSIIGLYKSGSNIGSIGVVGGDIFVGTADTTVRFADSIDAVLPAGIAGVTRDNVLNLGSSSNRWNDIYATNASIQTSDFNEKQDIASLTATEMLVGKRISALFKTFRWKDSVAEKGDNARTHTGVIAQDVQAAFTAEGLDAGDYALFISSTWWETQTDVPAVEAVEAVEAVTETTTDEDGNEVVTVITEAVEAVEAKDAYTRTDTYDTEAEAPEGATSKTRLGIRYPELLSFVAAYNEQRFASIEARLTALEA